jgi:hypothetical protein
MTRAASLAAAAPSLSLQRAQHRQTARAEICRRRHVRSPLFSSAFRLMPLTLLFTQGWGVPARPQFPRKHSRDPVLDLWAGVATSYANCRASLLVPARERVRELIWSASLCRKQEHVQ